MQTNRDVALSVSQQYAYKYEHFWSNYQPFFSDLPFSSANEQTMVKFYAVQSVALDPFLTSELTNLMHYITTLDEDITHVALLKTDVPDALYLYDAATHMFRTLSTREEPYRFIAQTMNRRTSVRAELGAADVDGGNAGHPPFGIMGALPYRQYTHGAMAIFYDTGSLNNLFMAANYAITPRILMLTGDGSVIFDSEDTYYGRSISLPTDPDDSMLQLGGVHYYLETITEKRGECVTLCLSPARETDAQSHRYTPMILLICACVSALAMFLQLLAGSLSAKRVHKLNRGIHKIGQNDLSFRFSEPSASPDEFDTIALAVNQMAENMQQYIEDIKTYAMLQKSAELHEIQLRFNPHFLYNTLESIRAHLAENDDTESSEMILLLANIFKSIMRGDLFVTIRDELSFINIYLELYRMRHKSRFEVYYDVDPTIQNCGVIRNLLQPVIENYFTHGFDPRREDNAITITGERTEDGLIKLTVKNNGLLMSPERLEQVRAMLCQETIETTARHYGLSSINARVKLFYGGESRLEIETEGDSTAVSIWIRPMTVEAHKAQLHIGEPPPSW